MKKTILLVIMSASILVLLASCSSGVSQAQYKKATDDLSTAQAQIQSLRTELSTAQTITQSLQTQFSAAQTLTQSFQTQLSTAQSQTRSVQSDLQSAKGKISQAKIIADLLDSLVQAYGFEDTLTAAQLADIYVQTEKAVKAIGDPQLSAKLDSMVNSINTSQKDKATQDFILYLFTFQSKILQ